MQIAQQLSQRDPLRLRAGVARCLAILGQPTHVGHADGVPVMVLAMCAHHLLRSSRLDSAVRRDHIVITAADPAERAMIAVDVRHAEGTARPVGGAVHDDQGDRPHRLQELGGGSTRRSGQYQYNPTDHIEQYALPVRLHTRRL